MSRPWNTSACSKEHLQGLGKSLGIDRPPQGLHVYVVIDYIEDRVDEVAK
jgi:hypothetical protein